MPFEQMPDTYLVVVPPEYHGLDSQRVQFNRVTIFSEHSPELASGWGTMKEGLVPLVGIQMKPSIREPRCGPGAIYRHDGISRAAVFITGLMQAGPQIEPQGLWRVRLQIRVGNGYISMAMKEYLFDFVPTAWPSESRQNYRQGLVFQYGGPLGNQVEVWGRMDTNGAGVNVPNYTASFTISTDRIGTPEQSIVGDSLTTTPTTPLTLPQFY